jgi:hypothetical protein
MMLTQAQLAKLFDTSRVSYKNWLAGKPIREKNAEKVRDMVRSLLSLVVEQSWPTPDVIPLTSGERFARLLELFPKPE